MRGLVRACLVGEVSCRREETKTDLEDTINCVDQTKPKDLTSCSPFWKCIRTFKIGMMSEGSKEVTGASYQLVSYQLGDRLYSSVVDSVQRDTRGYLMKRDWNVLDLSTATSCEFQKTCAPNTQRFGSHPQDHHSLTNTPTKEGLLPAELSRPHRDVGIITSH